MVVVREREWEGEKKETLGKKGNNSYLREIVISIIFLVSQGQGNRIIGNNCNLWNHDPK